MSSRIERMVYFTRLKISGFRSSSRDVRTICLSIAALRGIVKDIDTGRAILDTKYSLKRATAGTFPKFFSEGGSKELEFHQLFSLPVTHTIFRATASLYYPCHWLESVAKPMSQELQNKKYEFGNTNEMHKLSTWMD